MKQNLLLAGLLAWGLSAQAQTLPNAVWTCDFEGATTVADVNGQQIGSGELRVSDDPNFGTYYMNDPEFTGAQHTNYLVITQDGFKRAAEKSDGGVSFAFWVYSTDANEQGPAGFQVDGVDVPYYWYSVLCTAYNSQDSWQTWSWPMLSVNARLWMQINTAGFWDDFPDAENANGVNAVSVDWLKEGGWHHVAMVFENYGAVTKLYVDGKVMNEWNTKADFGGEGNFFTHLYKYDNLYVGGAAQWGWADPDPAFGYDDLSLYATALTADQIELIMDIKHGTLSEEDKIIVARGQLDAAKSELEDYAAAQGDTFKSAGDAVVDWLMEEIGDASDYTSIDDINAAIAKIQEKQNAVVEVVNAYEAAMKKIGYYTDLCNNTNYPGAAAFNEAIATATAAIADPTSVTGVEEGLQPLEAAKVAYLFSQEGDVIDVTRVINDPWFVDESYEPTVDEEGNLVFPEDAASHLSKEGWFMSISENLRGATDCTLYYTNGRTTANLFHSSTVEGGVLDIQQTLAGLPVGYYEVSADMSSSSLPTDNRVYGISGGVTKVSAIPASLAWSGDDTGRANWETLTTDKVYVGESGVLTIGATSTTNGVQYEGWFCVTNFRLMYYGTEYDMSADVAEKTEEARAAIETLTLAGDKANANTELATILAGETSDYEKVSLLTDLIVDVNNRYAQEVAFTALADAKALAEGETDETIKSIYNAAVADIDAALAAEDAVVDVLPDLQALYTAYVAYAATARAAQAWGTAAASSEVASQVASLTGSTEETLAQYQKALIGVMKASITEFEASETNPKDITGIVGNASFDADQYAAWSIDGTFAVQQAEIEFYNNSFDLYQVLTDMPAGTYKLTASGFYRDGNDYAAIRQNYNDGTYVEHANMLLYVKSASFNVAAPFVSIASDSLAVGQEEDSYYYDYYGNQNMVITDFTSLNADADPAIYYPYWMWNAYDMVTNRGLYGGNEVTFVVAEKQDLQIGVAKETTIAYDWSIIDNFHLYYLGQEIPDAVQGVEKAKDVAPAEIYTVSGAKVATLQKGVNIVRLNNGTVKKVLVK
ncbi:MAG: hypothetical protein IJV33_03175 [Bacteroidaceae bacterium]|nr:hypothetical protein [Bacteroidaceae bacterium]